MKIKLAMIAALAVVLSGEFAAAEERIVIGGSGSLNEEFADLAKAYLVKNPSDAIEVRPESMSTSGGLEGVRIERFNIGLVSRPPNSSEMGKLVYRPVARSMSAVVVHRSTSIANLSDAQVCDIFSGKIGSWKELGGQEGKIQVLTRKRDDNNTETFREKMACFRELKLSADAVALTRGSEVYSVLDKRPGTIGIANLGSSFRDYDSLKALAINGVNPSDETAKNGKYKYFHERGLVTLGEPQGLTKRFIDFMLGSEGQKIVGSQGAIPIR